MGPRGGRGTREERSGAGRPGAPGSGSGSGQKGRACMQSAQGHAGTVLPHRSALHCAGWPGGSRARVRPFRDWPARDRSGRDRSARDWPARDWEWPLPGDIPSKRTDEKCARHRAVPQAHPGRRARNLRCRRCRPRRTKALMPLMPPDRCARHDSGRAASRRPSRRHWPRGKSLGRAGFPSRAHGDHRSDHRAAMRVITRCR